MREHFIPPLTAVSEMLKSFSFSGAVELRPPAKKKILAFSAEPHAKLVGGFSHTVPDPQQDIYHQWTLKAHGIHPDHFHHVPIHQADAQIPDDLNIFAGIVAGGGSAMVTANGEWQERFQDVLRKIAKSEIPTLLTCYSMQAFIAALGGNVANNESGKRKFGDGLYEKTSAGKNHWLLDGLPDTFLAFRSNSQETTPNSLPEGIDVLAVDANDGAVAAIAYGPWLAGIQFHNDLDLSIMKGLAINRRDELADEGMTLDEFMLTVWAANSEVMQTNKKINGNFLQRMYTHHQQAVRLAKNAL